MTKYRLELYNPKTKHYYKIWEGPGQYAWTMFNKSYNARHTRRLIVVTEYQLTKRRAGQYAVG